MDKKLEADNRWYNSLLLDLSQFKSEGEEIMDRLKNRVSSSEDHELPELLRIENGINDVNTGNLGFRECPVLDKEKYYKLDMAVFKHLKETDDYCSKTRQRKSNYLRNLKYDRVKSHISENFSMFKSQTSSMEVENDIILTVDVMYPYNRILDTSEIRSLRLMKVEKKFLLRGETPLYELRKHILCLCDSIAPLEDGKELDRVDSKNTLAAVVPSSFIFIHDTFYVDDISENSTDISRPIREFMKKKSIFDKVYQEGMRGFKIIDLKLRLGQPYVFVHAGDCEHLLIFHSLRMLHPSDNQKLSAYPIQIFDKFLPKHCEVCRLNIGSFMIEGSKLMPNNYTLCCDNCFKEFCFTNGTKSHEFRAWPYNQLLDYNIS